MSQTYEIDELSEQLRLDVSGPRRLPCVSSLGSAMGLICMAVCSADPGRQNARHVIFPRGQGEKQSVCYLVQFGTSFENRHGDE